MQRDTWEHQRQMQELLALEQCQTGTTKQQVATNMEAAVVARESAVT